MAASNLRTALHLIERALDLHEEGADMDAGFDAGEFSGPAHWRAFQHDADQIARRCGFGGVRSIYTHCSELGILDETSWGMLQTAMPEEMEA